MEKNKIFQYSKVVNKPNKIIQSSQNMTTIQQKMFFSALAQIKYKITNNRKDDIQEIADTTYIIPIDEVLADFEKQKYSPKGGDLVSHIDNNIKALVKQTISVKNVDKNTLSVYNIIRYAEWQDGKNSIEVKFSTDVIPILVDMVKEGYTRLSLENIIPLRNVHSIRVYEEIMRFINLNKNTKRIKVKEYIISYQDLRFLLGMDGSKEYKLFADFRRFVLYPIRREILLYTNLSFDIEEIRERNKVKYLKFFDITIKGEQLELPLFESENNNVQNEQTEDIQKPVDTKINEEKGIQMFTEEQNEKLDKYLEGVFSADEIKSKHSFDYIEFYYKKAKELDDKGFVKNFPNFLYDLLNNDKQKYYELREKKIKQEEKKIAKEKAEKEMKKQKEQEEKEKKEKEIANQKRWTAMFDSLDEEKKKTYLEKLYAMNDFYKSFDKTDISDFTKWQIGKMIDDEQQ